MGRSTRHPKDDPSPVQSDDIVRFFQRLKGVYYGWWMAGVAAFVMCLGSVPLFQGMAVWNPVLRGHFGWSRSQLALAFSLTRVEGSIMGPIAGYIIDKIGPRSMVFVGLSVMGGGFLIFSQVRELWHLYVAAQYYMHWPHNSKWAWVGLATPPGFEPRLSPDGAIFHSSVWIDGQPVTENGRLLLLQDPELRELAAQYGDPYELLDSPVSHAD